MTWAEAKLSLQVMAEERVGSRVREEQMRARAFEDAMAEALIPPRRA